MRMKVLIVEDNDNDRIVYQDTIKTLNMELGPDLTFEATYAETKEEGLIKIDELKDELDGVFIDLKLSAGTTAEVAEGNDLIKEIYGKLRFPIIVLTNTPGAFDGNLHQSLFLQVITKTDDYRAVLMSLVQIQKTGVTKILGRRGLIEEMLDQIFWKNISITLNEWLNLSNCEKPLLRYTLTHLQEHLEISDDGTEFDTVHPIENYIIPSIKDYFFTGDIVRSKENTVNRYVILTPACDLAPHGTTKIPKTKDVLLAEIQPLNQGVFGDKLNLARKVYTNHEEQEQVEHAKTDLLKLMANNFAPKYYYLPDTTIIDGGLINFQKLRSIKLKELNNAYEKVATITVQFVKDIISKFSFYYSRQGSPDFDFSMLLNNLV